MIEPRPAATLAVTRDAGHGLEVLLVQRTGAAVFMPGVFVFPGGAVDDADHEPLPAARSGGIGDDEASRLIGIPAGGKAFLMAAVRECFEEAGLLLAEGGSLNGRDAIDLEHWRRRLGAGEATLAGLCEQLDLRLRLDRLIYLSRWVTPPGPPRRYDTRFFAAPAPAGQTARPDGCEVVDHLWITPRAALARSREQDLPLGGPTIRTLRTLADFPTTDALMRSNGPRPATLSAGPVTATGRDGPRELAPQEPAYAEAAKLRDAGLGPARYELIPGVAQPLSGRVARLTAANPGAMTGAGTNTYLVDGGEGIAVIDPGPELAAHVDAIVAAGGDAIRWILVTHTHRDHSPAARALQARTGAPLLGMPPPAGPSQDQTFHPDRRLGHGERLALGAATLRAIHTPGHASNHLCYLLEEENLLFSGDHIMQGSTVVISPPDGDMRAYLQALDALHHEDIDYIAPGHGFLMGAPHQVIDRIIAHRRAREEKVLQAVQRLGTASDAALLAAVYADVPAALHEVAARSLHAHLIKLRDDGVVRHNGSLWWVTA